MTLTILFILIITFVVWFIDRVLHWRICPICAGVSLTWLGMLGVRELGYYVDQSILAMLIGGSVVGIAYQLEKKLPVKHFGLLWKTLFISGGFIAGYGLTYELWAIFVAGLICTLLLTGALFHRSQSSAGDSKTVGELKKKMEQCC